MIKINQYIKIFKWPDKSVEMEVQVTDCESVSFLVKSIAEAREIANRLKKCEIQVIKLNDNGMEI